MSESVGGNAYDLLRITDYRRFLLGNLLALFASQMQTVAVGWELYNRTGRPLELGLVGLVQVIPVIALALPAGQVTDRFERKWVVMAAMLAFIVSSLGLAAVSILKAKIYWVYLFLFLGGVARAFSQPAKSALLPSLVPPEQFSHAVKWNTSGFQLATVVGPGIGGWLIERLGAAHWISLIDAGMTATFVVSLALMTRRPAPSHREPVNFRSLLGGVEFVWRTKLILGALALDMFAVLLGGATALLPIYAKDILVMPGSLPDDGAQALGWLRAAAGIGALITTFVMVHLPPMRRSGPILLLAVAGFGVATIAFGMTRNFWFAWSMLVVTGGLDMISVIIRHTLVQMATPDAMRGRVSAVNSVFISISNEMGAFESSTVAQMFHRPSDLSFGPTVSVVSGGIGTILVAGVTAWLVPALRRYDRLGEPPKEEP